MTFADAGRQMNPKHGCSLRQVRYANVFGSGAVMVSLMRSMRSIGVEVNEGKFDACLPLCHNRRAGRLVPLGTPKCSGVPETPRFEPSDHHYSGTPSRTFPRSQPLVDRPKYAGRPRQRVRHELECVRTERRQEGACVCGRFFHIFIDVCCATTLRSPEQQVDSIHTGVCIYFAGRSSTGS